MKSFDYPVGSTFDIQEINIVKKILNSGENLTDVEFENVK